MLIIDVRRNDLDEFLRGYPEDSISTFRSLTIHCHYLLAVNVNHPIAGELWILRLERDRTVIFVFEIRYNLVLEDAIVESSRFVVWQPEFLPKLLVLLPPFGSLSLLLMVVSRTSPICITINHTALSILV